MQFKRVKRPVHGVLLLDKPFGYSSNQALQKVRWLFQAAKAGHTGSLDPMATGLLPLCLGEATKFSHFMLDADKCYRANIRLGTTTTTGDAEGEVLRTRPVEVTTEQLERVLAQLTGEIGQVPPMYSALKHAGKALYEYARAGIDIPRESRRISIYRMTLEQFEADHIQLVVECSKGTYIRTLAEDIGEALGCGAHLIGLRRLFSGHLHLRDAVTIEQLEALTLEARDNALLPVEATIQHLPALELDADSSFYLQQGQAVWKSGLTEAGPFRLYSPAGEFIGTGVQTDDGRLTPKRLLVRDH